MPFKYQSTKMLILKAIPVFTKTTFRIGYYKLRVHECRDATIFMCYVAEYTHYMFDTTFYVLYPLHNTCMANTLQPKSINPH